MCRAWLTSASASADCVPRGPSISVAPSIDEQKFFYDPDFFKYFYTHAEPGYMQEPVYNDVAVPHDYDEHGTIELRDPGISQER